MLMTATAVVLSGALGSCSAGTSEKSGAGAKTKTDTTGKPSASTTLSPNVRKVAQPLDTKAFETDPCRLIPKATLASLGYTEPGKVGKQPKGSSPDCAWFSERNLTSLSVRIQTFNRDGGIGGLTGLYTGHESGQLPFLEKAPDVGEYQAVNADLQDRRGVGACNLHVGIADDLDFSIATQGYEAGAQVCGAAAQKAAAAVIATLKGG